MLSFPNRLPIPKKQKVILVSFCLSVSEIISFQLNSGCLRMGLEKIGRKWETMRNNFKSEAKGIHSDETCCGYRD